MQTYFNLFQAQRKKCASAMLIFIDGLLLIDELFPYYCSGINIDLLQRHVEEFIFISNLLIIRYRLVE